jgi:hypothetical protein
MRERFHDFVSEMLVAFFEAYQLAKAQKSSHR